MALLALAGTAASAHQKAHVHGTARLDIAIERNTLAVQFSSPLDNLLGLERAPRTAAERQAADALLARLKAGADLFKPDAAAGCTAGTAEVTAPVLQGQAGAGEHADVDASFSFTCTAPDKLKTLDHGLFEAFKRLSSLEVQMAGPKGQSRSTLKRPARTLTLVR
jgi:hypothetical protein